MEKDILRESLNFAVSQYKDYAEHNLLVTLTCVYEATEESFEVIFAISIDWLSLYLKEENKTLWSNARILKWLRNEYTSEDSQLILEKAMLKHKIAFYTIK